jgi:hypothetical protein
MSNEFFSMGFRNYLEKEAGIPKQLMSIGKYLKSTVVPKLVQTGKSLGSEYYANRLPGIIGGAAGFAGATSLYNNLTKGEDLDSGKLVDDTIENIKDFGMFDLGLFGLSKAFGGMKPMAKVLGNKIMQISGLAKKNLGPEASKIIKETIKKSKKAGENYVKGIPTPETSDVVKNLPLIGAGIGAATEYDSDSPVSSVARGAIGGGISGKLIGAIPNVKGSKEGVVNSLLDSLQAGLGFNAIGGAFERKAKRERTKELKKYYESISDRFNNPSSSPGSMMRGY